MARCDSQLLADRIAETDKLFAEGRCWCDCVKKDLPDAKRFRDEGNCALALETISEGLMRCSGSSIEHLLTAEGGDDDDLPFSSPTVGFPFTPLPTFDFGS